MAMVAGLVVAAFASLGPVVGMRSLASLERGAAANAASLLEGRSEASARNRQGFPFSFLTLHAAAACQRAAYNAPRQICEQGPSKCDCGEDAYFIGVPNSKTVSVGVADGIGSWRRLGVDAGIFAWELMNKCQEVADHSPQTSKPEPPLGTDVVVVSDPLKVLRKGYARVWASAEPPPGSSTACVAQLDRQSGELRVANLGDSGFMVLRDDKVVAQSTQQQHSFNHPYQLSVKPDETLGAVTPDNADLYTHKAAEGDLLILMTDGILDNLVADNVVEAVRDLPTRDPHLVARAVMEAAIARSTSQVDSPFSIAAREAGHQYPSKGKEDDMTVVVGRVEASEPIEPAPFFFNDP